MDIGLEVCFLSFPVNRRQEIIDIPVTPLEEQTENDLIVITEVLGIEIGHRSGIRDILNLLNLIREIAIIL